MSKKKDNICEKLDTKAVALHKIHKEDFFSEYFEFSYFDQLCKGIYYKLSFRRIEVKDHCNKLVRHIDELNQAYYSERNNYCNYIRYCLYEKIREIHTNKSAKIADVHVMISVSIILVRYISFAFKILYLLIFSFLDVLSLPFLSIYA
ncbi:hypothetical protein PCYB_002690 [Plasmodium cynomolgi strain B]|uniref:CYIR protein n=1 Tax=Plasmodium cynomolgi (strain B) TaxID=1120755 RepID=K6V2N9_PLACD|nr:hypothetical protein PCYB_002690 [Plasmodium cynomolgi strain B]GAB69520.1 hypothetical protein PCYB_002690 [Plasmodium cynomolgi strain B]